MAGKGGKRENAGRTPGAPNKVTAELKERIKTFLELNFDEAVNAFKNLDDKDKIMSYEKFLSYIVPKQSTATMNINDTTPKQFTVQIVDSPKPVHSEDEIDLTRDADK